MKIKNCLWFSALIFFIPAIALHAQAVNENIQLNQLGFYPDAKKIAVVTGKTPEGKFYVISKASRDTVFSDTLGALRHSSNSSLTTRIADFSRVKMTGSYYLYVPGMGNSYPFLVKNKVNLPAAVASLKGFYYQRASMPLDKKYAGKWSRPAGHPDTAVYIHSSAASASRPEGTIVSSPGGWYDAGDYNKYIVNSGITMGELLSAYEDFRLYFDKLNTNIPESNDKIPDLLNEVLYNLRWMFTMQDPNDGGVYHKCTNASFDGMVMPGVTKAPRYLVQKSTAATLDFAAVMAQASRVFSAFRKTLPGLADSALIAARYAYAWAEKNPALVYEQDVMNKNFKPPVVTGAYGDRRFDDEWFWAAAELLVTTGEKKYLDLVSKTWNDDLSLPSWANVSLLGYYSLIRNPKAKTAGYAEQLPVLKEKLVRFADGYLSHVETSAFQTVMGSSSRDFVWGSNAIAANQGIVLINAFLITKNKKYLDYALCNLDYILGRNATGYCFITGLGSKCTRHPHHRPSVADGIDDPVPGLLAGGPNPGKQDKCTYAFSEPETTYADLDCSYASNEIAINWNAPLVYLANALEALMGGK